MSTAPRDDSGVTRFVDEGPTSPQTQTMQKDAAAHLTEYFNDVHGYIEGEMAVQQEEWDFVARANEALIVKYGEVGTRVDAACDAITKNNTLLERMPEIEWQVDELEKQIAGLELVLRNVDDYTTALEKKFVAQPAAQHPGAPGTAASSSVVSAPSTSGRQL